MGKRIVIAGCRNYNNYEEAKRFIEYCLGDITEENAIIIVSGGAQGADAIGERFAIEKGYIIERYAADWKTYGRKAGPMRNKQMAEICDLLICFWDGKSKGTKSIIYYAKKYGKPTKIKMI